MLMQITCPPQSTNVVIPLSVGLPLLYLDLISPRDSCLHVTAGIPKEPYLKHLVAMYHGEPPATDVSTTR